MIKTNQFQWIRNATLNKYKLWKSPPLEFVLFFTYARWKWCQSGYQRYLCVVLLQIFFDTQKCRAWFLPFIARTNPKIEIPITKFSSGWTAKFDEKKTPKKNINNNVVNTDLNEVVCSNLLLQLSFEALSANWLYFVRQTYDIATSFHSSFFFVSHGETP